MARKKTPTFSKAELREASAYNAIRLRGEVERYRDDYTTLKEMYDLLLKRTERQSLTISHMADKVFELQRRLGDVLKG